MRKKQGLLSNSGMALMEVLVAMGILTIITMGVTSTISQSMKSQKDTAFLNSLANNKTNLTRLILDGGAWAYTVANNSAQFGCLQSTSTVPCNATTPANTYKPFNSIYDSSGNLYYQNPNGNSNYGFTPMGSTTNGTTVTPSTCSTFVPQTTPGTYTGNDACPIQYTLQYRFDCEGGVSQCTQPIVTVSALLVYNPSPQKLGSHSSTVINPSTYSVVVVRGSGSYVRNDSVFIAQQDYNGTTFGGGNCGVNTLVNRNYSSGLTATSTNGGVPPVDTASTTGTYVNGAGQGNLLGVDPTKGVYLAAGGYICDISGVAWATNGWTMQLSLNNNTGSPIAQQSSYAKKEGAYVQSEIVLPKVRLNLASNSYLTVSQKCSTTGVTPNGHGEASPAGTINYSMGIPLTTNGTSYGLSVYSSISCTRVY